MVFKADNQALDLIVVFILYSCFQIGDCFLPVDQFSQRICQRGSCIFVFCDRTIFKKAGYEQADASCHQQGKDDQPDQQPFADTFSHFHLRYNL